MKRTRVSKPTNQISRWPFGQLLRPAIRFCVSACAIALMLLPEVLSGAQVEFDFDRSVDQTNRYSLDQTVRQSFEVFGTRMETETSYSRVLHRTRTLDDQSNAQVEQGLERLILQMSNGGSLQFSFDSSLDDEADPLPQLAALRDCLRILSETTWTTELNAENAAISVQGFDALLQSAEIRAADGFAAMFDAGYLCGKEDAWFVGIPMELIEPGRTWVSREEIRLESGQSITVDRRLTYAGTEVVNGRELHAIDIEIAEAQWSIPSDAWEAVTLSAESIEIEQGTGRLMIDESAGRVESRRESIKLRGDVEFRLGQATGQATIEIDIDTEVQYLTP